MRTTTGTANTSYKLMTKLLRVAGMSMLKGSSTALMKRYGLLYNLEDSLLIIRLLTLKIM